MDKKELEMKQKYYLEQILFTCCGGEADLAYYKFNRVFVIFGYTGSGKDCIIDRFLEHNNRYPFSKFVRTLTRDARPDERAALSGFYVENDFFDYLKSKEKFFFSYDKYDGDQFGYNIMHLIFLLSRGHVMMIGGSENNLSGLTAGIRNVFKGVPITTVFINRPKEAILEGIRKRGGDPKEIEKRCQYIETQWKPQPERHFDFILWNDDMDEALAAMDRIVSETLSPEPKV